MVNVNIRTIIEDMNIHETVEGMLKEAIDQGLIQISGYHEGEPTFALSRTGRRMVEESDLAKYIEHEIEALSDD
jgi:DNA-binding transcriptional regulator LsrR (DeoR family)